MAMCSLSRTRENPRNSKALRTFILGASTGKCAIKEVLLPQPRKPLRRENLYQRHLGQKSLYERPPPSALITTLTLFPPASPTAAHRDFLDTPWSPALPSHLFPVDTNSGWQVQQLCAMVAFLPVALQDAPLHRLLPADQGSSTSVLRKKWSH